jgi:endogenous inhibitor of DNA gyrase (YacG/DUF329 family)
MAVVRCTHCGKDHVWYANNGIIPRGYCSLLCYLDRRRPRRFNGDMHGLDPEKAQEITAEIREHLLIDHQEIDVMNWHADCPRCQHLDARLAAALQEATLGR